jgi:glycosyltransferase involved in cell wall biosynthesis
LIADANSIACRFKSKFRREAVVIPYGAQVAQEVALTRSDENIPNSSYYLAVARMVPETNIPLIIKGFLLSGTDADLLVIGPIKDQQFFDTEVAPLLGGKVKYLGSIYDSRRLGSLRAFSRALLHGHGSEGTNPSLVESLAYGSFLIAYDSESNRVVGGVDAKYFKTEKELANQIKTRDATSIEELSVIRRANIARAERDFSWGANARQHALALNLS